MTHKRPTDDQHQAIIELIRSLPADAHQSTRIQTAHTVSAMILAMYRDRGWAEPRRAWAFLQALKYLPRVK